LIAKDSLLIGLNFSPRKQTPPPLGATGYNGYDPLPHTHRPEASTTYIYMKKPDRGEVGGDNSTWFIVKKKPQLP